MAVLSDEMKRLVREQRLGYVATVTPAGLPCVSPKGSLTVLDDDHLVFADVESPHTVKNLEATPNVEVNVVDPYRRKGFRFTGTSEILHSGVTYWKVLEMYRDEGSDVRRIRSVVIIRVHQATPLVSPIYATHAEEDDVSSLWEQYYSKRHERTVLDRDPPRDF